MSKKNDKPAAETSNQTTGSNSPRRIFLFGRLENEVALPVIKKLLRMNDADKTKPIDLLINSAGGNGYNADAIIGVIHSMEAPVNTICLGHALSGACEILAAGTGKRLAYEFSTIMFHQTLWEADGDITNLEIQAKQGQKFREAQIELLHRCTRKDKKTLRHDIERDYYLSAKEALDYGIIDEIIYHNVPSERNGRNHKTNATPTEAVTAGGVTEKSKSGSNAGKNLAKKAAKKSGGRKQSNSSKQ